MCIKYLLFLFKESQLYVFRRRLFLYQYLILLKVEGEMNLNLVFFCDIEFYFLQYSIDEKECFFFIICMVVIVGFDRDSVREGWFVCVVVLKGFIYYGGGEGMVEQVSLVQWKFVLRFVYIVLDQEVESVVEVGG